MSLGPDKTTFELSKTTNKRAALLQLQLDLKSREELLKFLLDFYHDNQIKK